MSNWRLALRSLAFHWRESLALALGVAAATAVLCGALVIGDSVRESLRHLILDRLGRIDQILVADRFFRPELAAELSAGPEFHRDFEAAIPAIVLEATIDAPNGRRRVNHVTILGPAGPIRQLGHGGPSTPLGIDQIAVNAPLADELKIAAGDEVILRLPAPSNIPRDSPLGRKTDAVRNRRLTVVEIVPAQGLGSFSLRASQQIPRTVFVAPQTVQAAVDEPDKVNAILVTAKSAIGSASAKQQAALASWLAPTLSDFGLSIEKTRQGYFNLTSQRMILEPAVDKAALQAFPAAQPALTYLANTIASGRREIPYSTVTALDPAGAPPLGPFETTTGEKLDRIADDEIVLNTWAADDLQVAPGAKIKLVFFRPESTHGTSREETAEFRLAAVVKLQGAADDREFTPTVKGITDKESIDNWDAPFPSFNPARVRSADEAYWDQYRGTPKAFVSLATGRRLWGSRFGEATSVRIVPPDNTATADSVAARIRIDPAKLGFVFRPIKRLGLSAAAGTTPFNLLFLGFSFFIILAALLLVTLLYRLSIESRAREIGILYAVGWSAAQVRRFWLLEGALVILIGSGLGTLLGAAYARLLLAALNTWWVDAIASPFVALHISPISLTEGFLGGAIVALLTMSIVLRHLRRLDTRRLLAGGIGAPTASSANPGRGWLVPISWLSLIGALALAIFGIRLSGETQAGAFMGSGVGVLCGLLLRLWNYLRRSNTASSATAAGPLAISQLSVRNSARNPMRSILTIGLVSAATFLIVAISAFRISPPALSSDRNTGTGGLLLIADCNQPIYGDLNDPQTLTLSRSDSQTLCGVRFYPIRVASGDDASCLNLFRPQQPRLLGLPEDFLARGGFSWNGSLGESAEEQANPWLLLAKDFGTTPDGRSIMPVVIDSATAQYSLHLGDLRHPGGLGTIYELASTVGSKPIPCRVVGLLKNSILQGDLITAEGALLKHFPEATGFRLFAIDGPVENADKIAGVLERSLGDYGFAAQTATARLAEFMSVQNTYLATFQTLGALGLLLGTFGLAVVELRNVLERRGELALLRAVGFRHKTLSWLVLCENLSLLMVGLGIGLAAAFISVSPHLVLRDAAIPWATLLGMLGLIPLVAFVTSLAAVTAMLQAPLIPALRGD